MTDSLKILGQTSNAASLTAVYTVPASTSAVVAKIVVTNQSAADVTYRVSFAVNNAADATKQYIAYDAALPPNQFEPIPLGVGLAAGDVVRVLASSNSVSFNVFGMEVT